MRWEKKKREKKSRKVPTKTKTKTKSQKAPTCRRLVWRTAGAKGKLCSRGWRRIMQNNKWKLYQFRGNKYHDIKPKYPLRVPVKYYFADRTDRTVRRDRHKVATLAHRMPYFSVLGILKGPSIISWYTAPSFIENRLDTLNLTILIEIAASSKCVICLHPQVSQILLFSNHAILKFSNSQIQQFSNFAILKFSDLGSPPPTRR